MSFLWYVERPSLRTDELFTSSQCTVHTRLQGLAKKALQQFNMFDNQIGTVNIWRLVKLYDKTSLSFCGVWNSSTLTSCSKKGLVPHKFQRINHHTAQTTCSVTTFETISLFTQISISLRRPGFRCACGSTIPISIWLNCNIYVVVVFCLLAP